MSFRGEVYGPEEPALGTACFVVGFGDTLRDFERPVIVDLVRAGYRVAAYEYSPNVLASGQPDNLVRLIDDVGADFERLAAGTKRRLFVGISLGALIAKNLQNQETAPSAGIYIGAGVPLADVIIDSMSPAWRRFQRAGVNETVLRQAWSKIDISADKPPAKGQSLVLVLGGSDEVVPPAEATEILHAWEKAGVPLSVIIKHGMSHQQVIRWATYNMPHLLAESDRLKA